MECPLGDIKTALYKVGHGLTAAVERGLDGGELRWLRAVEDKVGDILAQSQGAGMANANAKSPERWPPKGACDVSNAIVAAMAPTLFEANGPWRQVKLVVHNQNGLWRDLVEAGSRADRAARVVHEGLGHEEPAARRRPLGCLAREAEQLGLCGEGLRGQSCETLNEPEPDVVSGLLVFSAGIAQACDER